MTMPDPGPAFVMSDMSTPSISRASISMIFGVQKPAWHLPMQASVQRFTASSDRAPSGACMAFTIWASLTLRQRQITRP